VEAGGDMMDKDNVSKVILSLKKKLALSFLFIFFLTLRGWAMEMGDWQQISTQNAGTLSLPPGWNVVSQDDPAERSPDAERMFHVQLALYAQNMETLANARGTLQVFSIWNADREGKVLPLPPYVLDETDGDFAAGLIGARYGKVKKVGEDLVPTALEDLTVAAYEAEFSSSVKTSEDLEANPVDQRFRYRYTSLFCGDKLVLVLVKYLPEGEEYWRQHFETLLDAWVASLTLTPSPLKMTVDRVPLPDALPILFSVLETNLALEKKKAPSFILSEGFALAVLVIFLACLGKIFFWHRKKKREKCFSEKMILDDFRDLLNENPDKNLNENLNENPDKNPNENPDKNPDKNPSERSETNEEPGPEKTTEATLLVVEENLLEKSSIEENLVIKETMLEENLVEDSFEPSECDSCDSDVDQSDVEKTGNEVISGVREEPETSTLTRKPGFDKVYDLLNRALTDLDAQLTSESQTPKHYASKKAMPNLPETVEILDGLDTMFGESFVMETLKEAVFKALELKEGTLTLPTKDTTRECFVLRLCCDTLVNMVRSGRYHIGKGILSNEGEALVYLFERINSLQAHKGCSTLEEVARDSAFMRFSVRESGGYI
jgi:hypothetical protein